jgi:hypothetical protein
MRVLATEINAPQGVNLLPIMLLMIMADVGQRASRVLP